MKKYLSAILVLVMLVCMVGCVTKDTDTSNAAVEAADYQKSLETNAKVYKKFIKVPDYNGLEVEVDMSILEVTDKDIDDYIQNVLTSYAETKEVKEGVTKKGDVIVLDFEGKLNGVAFSGGTATDTEYTIGSGRFIDDLDKGLVGLTLGQTYDIPCKFPADYSNSAELAGKDVIFTVKVSAIKQTIIPELTDEWVVANAEELGTEEKTVDGLKKSVKEYLVAVAEIDYASEKFYAAVDAIKSKIETDKYPQKELDALKATYKNNVETEYKNMASYYTYLGVEDYDGYLKYAYDCDSEDEFDEVVDKRAKDYLLEKMIVTIIAVDKKVEVTADEIKELGEEYAADYNQENYDAMVKEFGKVVNAELGYTIANEKVMEIVNGAVTEVAKKVEPESETASEAASESVSESASK